jgi:hypothetical protein
MSIPSLSQSPNPAVAPSGAPVARQLVWIPVLMVAALLFWTVALGLGGRSLMAVTVLRGGQDAVPSIGPRTNDEDALRPAMDDADSIQIHLQESAEPEDVNDNVGSGVPAVGDDPSAVSPPGPGATAF